MWYVYVLQNNENRKFYKGLTNNINRRIKQHELGQISATRTDKGIRLIHVELCDSRNEARQLEKYFKSGFGREIIKELAEINN